MGYEETIKEEGGLRVALVYDEYADAPYNDGMAPLLEISHGYRYGGYTASQVERVTSYEVDSDLAYAVEKFLDRHGYDLHSDLLLRYLSIFWGVTRVETLSSYTYQSGGTYLAIDPADWRETVGADADREDYSLGTEEWQAYLDGDVYGYRVEERVTWAPVDRDSYDTMNTWEEVDSCWGFYGREWAEQSALAAFEDAKEEAA